MSERKKVGLGNVSTGVPGLDEVLGGGLPEYSFNLIAGSPGAGKTTLAHQVMFANATESAPALYYTVLGEPSLKMLRYQQQHAFFDVRKVGSVMRFSDLSREVVQHDLARVLETIVRQIEETQPALVFVDSFRTVARSAAPSGTLDFQSFLQHLALHLASWQATTFLVGEYQESEFRDNPVFTIADGILSLQQVVAGSSSARRLHVVKMRGRATMPGLHAMRIDERGVRVYPRREPLPPTRTTARSRRISTGLEALDAMLGGGIPADDALLVSGPSGAGKTALARHFVAAGAAAGEAAVVLTFEEHAADYAAAERPLGAEIRAMIEAGKLVVLAQRPVDLSVEETLDTVRAAALEIGATRVVVDSLSAFELGLSSVWRDEIREALGRFVTSLRELGATVLLTVESDGTPESGRGAEQEISLFAQNVVRQHFVQAGGELHRVIGVVKMRSSAHSSALCAYDVGERGLVFRAEGGTGVGRPPEGLTKEEASLLERLEALGEATPTKLARAAGLPGARISRALRRLVELGYARRFLRGGRPAFAVKGRTGQE